MNNGKGSKKEGRSLWQVFRWPLLLALISSAALLSALLGDGVWDALSWLLFVPPLALCARAIVRASRRGG